ncbi:39S ribosomal protein L53, mitochondrial isoform X1 [Canis lupus dingo]|uniref:39S ribosomal protein L53, mitochondrial isoform X1 n=1 Tax=Canis lupus dingo TaxID=286419 RepID=UPI000DC690F8|nr:39S ribosomal protein L53, mitochondrial isoform X1 [Canis lupus dingo]
MYCSLRGTTGLLMIGIYRPLTLGPFIPRMETTSLPAGLSTPLPGRRREGEHHGTLAPGSEGGRTGVPESSTAQRPGQGGERCGKRRFRPSEAFRGGGHHGGILGSAWPPVCEAGSGSILPLREECGIHEDLPPGGEQREGDGHRLIMRGAHLTAQEMLTAFASHIQARTTAGSGDKPGPGTGR